MRDPPVKPSPLDSLWQAPVIIWVVLAGEGLAAVLALAPNAMDGGRWVFFGLVSLIVQWVLLTTLGCLYLLRHRLAGARPPYIAWCALLLLVLATWLIGGLLWLLQRSLVPTAPDHWTMMFLRLTGIAVVVGFLGLAAFQNHWRTRQLAVKAKQSELEALQARIRPHFLFNTLNTGAALIHQRPEDAERVLLDLADLFRAALAGPREIPLAEEFALTRRYLEIESLRFRERLTIHWRLPDTIPDVLIPTLSIQPLAENAIRHGIEPDPAGGTIWLCLDVSARWIDIEVRNTLPPRPAASIGHQVGQTSVHARLQALTEGQGQLQTRQENGTYIAVIRLPAPGQADDGPLPRHAGPAESQVSTR